MSATAPTPRAVLRPDARWVAPPTTIFIAGSGRSGSNFLCDAMASTGVLGKPTEWLNLREMARRYPRVVSTAADCCCMIATSGTTPNGIAATKLLANHFTRLGGQIVLGQWFPHQRWIYLRRKDIVAQAVSRTIAAQTGHWTSGLAAPAREPAYSRAEIDANLAQITASDAFWNRYFAAEGIEPLPLWYEELEEDLHGAVREIARHVGGQALSAQMERTPPYVTGKFDLRHERQRNETNFQWRVRYMRGD